MHLSQAQSTLVLRRMNTEVSLGLMHQMFSVHTSSHSPVVLNFIEVEEKSVREVTYYRDAILKMFSPSTRK